MAQFVCFQLLVFSWQVCSYLFWGWWCQLAIHNNAVSWMIQMFSAYIISLDFFFTFIVFCIMAHYLKNYNVNCTVHLVNLHICTTGINSIGYDMVQLSDTSFIQVQVLPLPNIPFFWVLFRAYSHWRALQVCEVIHLVLRDVYCLVSVLWYSLLFQSFKFL